MKFIQLKDQVVNADTIVKVDKPRQAGSGLDWYIRTLFDSTKTEEFFVSSTYHSKEEAEQEYNRIVAQLCSDK